MSGTIRLPSFNDIDRDGDEHIGLGEINRFIPPEQRAQVAVDFNNADEDGDGRLNRREFKRFVTWQKKAYRLAEAIVIPGRERQGARAEVDGDGAYSKEYSCCPPPIFMFTITTAMVGIFISHTLEIMEKIGPVGINGPPPMDSKLIYDPYRRYEVWRYLTYMFVHSGWIHIASNVVMQLLLGIPLEMVHGWWRMLTVYCLGVIAGSLATSLTDPKVFLAGASGGVYALMTAHVATVIMNWSDMGNPWIRVISFSLYAVFDVGVAFYYRYVEPIDTKIGYAAHLGGAIFGLLVGVCILRNLYVTRKENVVWWVALVIAVILSLIAICWNVFYTDYFPAPRYT